MKKEKPYKILIVDDNHNNLVTLRMLINEYINADVIEADSGEKALQYLYENSVDLILLDIQMEGMDGFEVASFIKKRKKTQDIPIVFLTAAYISAEFKKRGFETGAVDYITKPIDEYQLINRINVYLRLIEKERQMNVILEKKVQEQTKKLLEQTKALKKQAEALQKAKEEAVAANEAKGMFLANITHELRTPLNILLSSTQLINYYLDNHETFDLSKFRQKLDMQTQNCNRLLRLVNNLIDITKIDTGNFTLFYSKCNIVQIIEAITLSIVDYANAKGIHISFNADIKEKIISCDLDAIERIILNLFSNAIKFTHKGGSIFVNLQDKGSSVRIIVKDTGIGIRKDMQNLIFERFKQVDNLLTRQNEGSGIGLSLVKSLVEMHGGQIHVRSEYQSGSKFVIDLPVESHCARSFNTLSQNGEPQSNSHVIRKVNIEFSDIYFN